MVNQAIYNGYFQTAAFYRADFSSCASNRI
nr:MAG TPA: hypothetical protein [Caudoviricetes sp.]